MPEVRDLEELRDELRSRRGPVILQAEEVVDIIDRVLHVERRLQGVIETNELWDGS